MNIIKQIFASVNGQYLFKSYFFSAILTILFFIVFNSTQMPMMMYVYCLICGIAFPFAAIVWDDLIATIMGNIEITLPILIMLTWKFFKILLLYMFTPLIAPFGFLYIYIVNGFHKRKH